MLLSGDVVALCSLANMGGGKKVTHYLHPSPGNLSTISVHYKNLRFFVLTTEATIENRPNPIVTLGLFMEADGIPLAFDIFPGNQNEQTTLKPLGAKDYPGFQLQRFYFLF